MDPSNPDPAKPKKPPTEQIDTLFDDLFPESVVDVAGIDNLYDDLLCDPAGRKGSPAILEFLEGGAEEVTNAILFQSVPDEITFTPAGETSNRTVALNRCACVGTAEMPTEFPEIGSACPIELIETIDSKKYQAFVPPAQYQSNGVFGFSTVEKAKCKYLFFPATSIKLRTQKRFLGEILIEKKLIAGEILRQALVEQQELKQRKLGRILAEQTQVKQALLEREIQKIYTENIQQLKVGEILVASGLVDEEQVTRALATQAQLKKKKIGQYLIEKGLLKEDEVFMALAEKFRIPYIDLRKKPIGKKTVELLPWELIVKLQVLPIAMEDDCLVVATMIPDVPAIKEIIVKHSGQQSIKLVLCRPTLLRSAIKQLRQATAPPK